MAKTELKKLFDKAWKLQSEYVRKRDTGFNGYGRCCTCGKAIEYKQAHAGHYHHGYLDFIEENTNLQCAGCNTYRGGELGKYSLFLIRKYGGVEILERLETQLAEHKRKYDQTGKKYTKEELLQIIEDLKIKISKL